jgi:hypothetical protein
VQANEEARVRGGQGTLWVAILIALIVVAVIYSVDLLVTGEGAVEHWDDLLIPIAVSSIAAAVIGWRVGARQAGSVRAEVERETNVLRRQVVELERELDATRDRLRTLEAADPR